MKRTRYAIFYIFIYLFLVSCQKRETEVRVSAWISKVNDADNGMEHALHQKSNLFFAQIEGSEIPYTIQVNEDKQFQEMIGFGASYTEASAYLLQEKLSEHQRAQVIDKLFNKQRGIGLSMIRQPIGACDHVLAQYDYASVAEDFKLEHFDISHDTLYKIPIIKQSLAVHPGRVKVTCATWSPPAWMKTNNSFLGEANGIEGHLREDCYDVYALYLKKFIDAYEKAGIPIFATSIQNEPDHASDIWPAMKMSSAEQSKLIKDHLAPLLNKSNKKVQIWCWDHNFDTPGYPEGKFVEDILGDDSVAKYVSGSAWHWYSGGFPEVLYDIQEQFPDKDMHFTEGSGGDWNPVKHWRDGFAEEMRYIINLPRAYVSSIVWWNIALSENNGPDYYYRAAGTGSTCRGLITVNQVSGDITYNADYYSLGHISKFVDPGARRIDTNQWENDLENVAFVNPDGSTVLIVYNPGNVDKAFKVKWKELIFSDNLPSGAAITYVWNDNVEA